jgi:Na+-translocating ferredoxin:NAD+ oxidoreductase RnfC subunit
VAEELAACIRCNECLVACPALSLPISIETLNRETMAAGISPSVARFAQACYQCGACVPVCPVGLHRDAMMLWLKMRLLRGEHTKPTSGDAPAHAAQPYLVARRVHRSHDSDENAYDEGASSWQ